MNYWIGNFKQSSFSLIQIRFMRRFTYRLTSLAFLLCAFLAAKADHLTPKFLFAARMNSAQEVPAFASPGVGVATFMLNSSSDTLCITMTVNNLSGPITGAHIHDGRPGVSGPIVKDLVPFLSGNSLQVTLAGSGLSGLSVAKLFAGDYYINVHTAANPGGEIRGQILLEEDRSSMGRLTGSESSPPIATNARGLAFFMLSQHNQKLSFHVVLDSLDGAITGAHLHKGLMGSSGPIIQDLMPFLNGNVISGSVDPSAYLSTLLADSVYINIHTTPNPGGLIRAQLFFWPYLYFDARMEGAQEVPAVTTTARGLGVFRVNYAMDTAYYDLQMTGLSGPITASHIHRGPAGVSGPVLVPFPSATIFGNTISGAFPLVPGTAGDSLKRMLLEGGLYANVHTAANPAGEIRGQIYRTAREGYTFALTGSQEAPAVATPAYGSGMVSIDRDQTNAHFMIVGTNLTPTLAHFHQGVAGVSGPVIFNLGSYMANGGIYGYWLEDDATTPFDATFSNKFRKDSIYVNMHTAANPGGEIRGQALRTLCTPPPNATGVGHIGNEPLALRVFPNPAGMQSYLELSLPKPVMASLRITDISGRIIWTSSQAFKAGKYLVSLPVLDLADGMYYVSFTSDEGQITLKLVKE
jgi:hypothetical protein